MPNPINRRLVSRRPSQWRKIILARVKSDRIRCKVASIVLWDFAEEELHQVGRWEPLYDLVARCGQYCHDKCFPEEWCVRRALQKVGYSEARAEKRCKYPKIQIDKRWGCHRLQKDTNA